jgi:RNA polymerase sigma-70 factor (ECF subfamily)
MATARVAQRVETHTWRAFQLLALQGLSGANVAASLDMPISLVYAARSRVQKMIQNEIRQLEGTEPSE